MAKVKVTLKPMVRGPPTLAAAVRQQRSPLEHERSSVLKNTIRRATACPTNSNRFSTTSSRTTVFFATKHHGAPFVSYIILAEMVKAGWRLAAEPTSKTEPATP